MYVKTRIKVGIKQFNKENFLRKIRITMGSETLCVEGLIDSGNCVFDEKSALPVMFLSTGGADKLHISGEPENSRNF